MAANIQRYICWTFAGSCEHPINELIHTDYSGLIPIYCTFETLKFSVNSSYYQATVKATCCAAKRVAIRSST